MKREEQRRLCLEYCICCCFLVPILTFDLGLFLKSMSQPGFEGNYGGGYGGGYGPPSSQPYNSNFQSSYVGGNQGISMENNEVC